LLIWLRRFYLAAHERREWGIPAYLLSLFAGPVYTAAAVAAVLRRPLSFTVTAKGSLRTTDSAKTFRLHMRWAAVMLAAFGVSLVLNHGNPANAVWALLTVTAGLVPLVLSRVGGGHPRVPPTSPTQVSPVPPVPVSPAPVSALVYEQRNGHSGRQPHLFDHVPVAHRSFVGVAQVVEGVGVRTDPD
jgi:hypothetical protein